MSTYKIHWDDNFFERSGLYVWIYNNGMIETTNERFYKYSLGKVFRAGHKKNFINKNKGRKHAN